MKWLQFIYIDKTLAVSYLSYIAQLIDDCGLRLPDPCPQPTVVAEDIAGEAAWAAAAAARFLQSDTTT